ncbi:uncharacterized protein LOC129182026 isoform X3 [Dunckerocampus dactyliophorus]|uniref:uncharacterized protein LOC129182026 isoform X3 n=1 Tax=Dunckerocampus dactyliophorus TaxID=161453 RepID=UPI0024068272|nr:uncharacterized protein LOC129182026 isoform X3 [Dunckerocampus dactyliophorus]
MQAAFFPFLLVALHVSVPVDCGSKFKGLEELHQNSLRAGMHADAPMWTHYYRAGSMRKRFLRAFLVLLPVRMDKSDFVSVFDLRRKHFVCMDSKGQLYNSRQKEREDCLFHRTGFISGVFYSPPSGSQLPLSPLESSHPSFVFLKRFLAPLVTRQRRSEEVFLLIEAGPSFGISVAQEPKKTL